MCEYFVKADPIQYEQRTRTVRIRGALTSISTQMPSRARSSTVAPVIVLFPSRGEDRVRLHRQRKLRVGSPLSRG